MKPELHDLVSEAADWHDAALAVSQLIKDPDRGRRGRFRRGGHGGTGAGEVQAVAREGAAT